jgi:phosphatidylglycerol---prolipoprotein diacylglyceryl transferase
MDVIPFMFPCSMVDEDESMMGMHVAYTLFMLLAAGVFLLVRRCIPRPPGLAALPMWKRLALVGAVFVGGTLGAKLPFALSSKHWWTIGAWFSDGKTVVAGLICAYLAVELTKLALGIRVKTGDTFALPLALAMVVGRIGCFCNGCCYGVPTTLPWGVGFVRDGQFAICHPTQLYESLFHLGMAAVLLELLRRGRLRGHHLQVYLISYGVYRFLTEFIRPEPVGWLGLTFYQWGSLALVAAMAAQWAIEARIGAVRTRGPDQSEDLLDIPVTARSGVGGEVA